MADSSVDANLPSLRVNDLKVRPDRQQCILRCTNEAQDYGRGRRKFAPPNTKLTKEETAIGECKRHLVDAGVADPKMEQYLGLLTIPFGKYNNCTFKWLVENDVGYVKL